MLCTFCIKFIVRDAAKKEQTGVSVAADSRKWSVAKATHDRLVNEPFCLRASASWMTPDISLP